MDTPVPDYDGMTFRRSGRSGLDLPAISLGLWQNFGEGDPVGTQRAIVRRAVERGITQIDLANNYGPPPGSAEESFGRMLATDLRGLRDELVITTKAGYRMWPGPYGEFGSRKYLLASLDQSLRRLGLEYVDIFYSHRFDESTPLEETIGALHTAVTSGKALYAGLSSYSARRTQEAVAIAERLGLALLVHQPSYSIMNRWIEQPQQAAGGKSLLDVVDEAGMGVVAFSPLAQGMLTAKYLDGVPAGSRASREASFRSSMLTDDVVARLRRLNEVAAGRGQTLAQLALAWALRDRRVTSVLVGASSVTQLDENLATLENLELSADELAAVEDASAEAGVNIWARSSDL